MINIDAILWAFLAVDLAELRLPSPPLVPRFEAETIRPGKRAS